MESSDLNKAQEEAVLRTEGPILVAAGAGSGKTKVLAHRIAHLIEKGVRPDAILAITFTNKAASEMRDRVMKLITQSLKLNSRFMIHNSGSLPWVGTFHSFSAFILRESGKLLKIPKSFTILDEEDSLHLIKDAVRELELDPKQFEPRRIRGAISRKKNEMISFADYQKTARDYFPKVVSMVWEKYDEKLKSHTSLDFDDLMLYAVKLLANFPEILDGYQERWKYIHIDEYQDTNLVQYHLALLLAKKYRNICVVGDIDQAIYSWRGADFRNILHFERDWPEAKLITLEENYRSTQLILDAANAVIVKNKFRVPKNLFSGVKSGPKIVLFEASNEEEEANFIAEIIHRLKEKGGTDLREIAILYRTNFQSRVIEEKMLALNIPYQVIGVKFYERREIKDVLAYFKSALNPGDLLSLKRIVNMPPRGIGKTLITKMLVGDSLKEKDQNKISGFKNLMADVKKAVSQKTASEAIKFVIAKSGLKEYLNDGTEEGAMRYANVEELVTLAKRHDGKNPPEGILSMLEEVALMSAEDTIKKDENSVKLMTVHAAKGLEFKAVFVAGLEEGLFPHRAILGEELEIREEEERRLFYVALTRAKEKLFLSYAVFRTIFGERKINRPSSFLFDIPDSLLEKAPEKIMTIEL